MSTKNHSLSASLRLVQKLHKAITTNQILFLSGLLKDKQGDPLMVLPETALHALSHASSAGKEDAVRLILQHVDPYAFPIELRSNDDILSSQDCPDQEDSLFSLDVHTCQQHDDWDQKSHPHLFSIAYEALIFGMINARSKGDLGPNRKQCFEQLLAYFPSEILALDRSRNSALAVAVSMGNQGMLQTLIEKGVLEAVRAKASPEKPCLEFLLWAIALTSPMVGKEFLEFLGTTLNPQVSDKTSGSHMSPLQFAIFSRRQDAIEILIPISDPLYQSVDGKIALDYALDAGGMLYAHHLKSLQSRTLVATEALTLEQSTPHLASTEHSENSIKPHRRL